jgi:hypothetical protein
MIATAHNAAGIADENCLAADDVTTATSGTPAGPNTKLSFSTFFVPAPRNNNQATHAVRKVNALRYALCSVFCGVMQNKCSGHCHNPTEMLNFNTECLLATSLLTFLKPHFPKPSCQHSMENCTLPLNQSKLDQNSF